MKNTTHVLLSARTKFVALAFALDEATVERDTPKSPPTAFRIWRAGENRFDDGIAYFTRESAKALADQQAARNRPYAFDYRHLSLLSEVPEAGKAAGWHRLEMRDDANGEPECWAVSCEWTEPVAKAMSADVPEWRFFSPAFQVSEKTNVIVGYTNCAITNDPLTHDLPMLASVRALAETHQDPTAGTGARSKTLDPKTALAILADPNATPEDRQAALECLAALVSSTETAATPPPAEEQRAAAPPANETEEQRASVALAVSHTALQARVDELEVREMLHGRVLPVAIRDWCAKQKPAVVRSFLASATDFRPPPNAERRETPTQGATTGTGFVAPAVGESPVDRVLGLTPAGSGKPGVSAPVHGVRRINTLLPSQIRKAGA